MRRPTGSSPVTPCSSAMSDGRICFRAAGHSSADLAGQLYRSLHDKLLTLPDETRVFPAHGAGSACGRSLSSETSSTIGEQRRANYALTLPSEAVFVAAVTEGQSPAPPYFSFDAQRNREQRFSCSTNEHAAGPGSLSPSWPPRSSKTWSCSTPREPHDFAAAHLRGSINVGLEGGSPNTRVHVLLPEQRIVLLTPPGRELEAKIRLGRIGFDNVVGFLADPTSAFAEHPDAVDRSSRLTALELLERRAGSPIWWCSMCAIPANWPDGAIPGAMNRAAGTPHAAHRRA